MDDTLENRASGRFATKIGPRACFFSMLLPGVLALTSCSGTADDRLVVATDLTAAETAEIESAYRNPTAQSSIDPLPRLVWLRVRPTDDPASALRRGARVDVVLGASASSLRTLQGLGMLEPLASGPAWRVYRRAALGRAVRRTSGQMGQAVLIDDPRLSAVSLAGLRTILDDAGWNEGYRRVLSLASHDPLIGLHNGESLSRLLRDEVPAALTRSDEVPTGAKFLADVPTAMVEDGVAIVRGSSHLAAAKRFLSVLEGQGRAAMPPANARQDVPLLPELLGAVLVDTQPELIEARRAVDAAGISARAEKWFVPPPWPPASVAKLKRSDPSGALVESLAEQLVPDFASRLWLLESWNRPPRPIDAALLRELGEAAEGKLIAEPRFRRWLAVEWRTWARQCYRRVTRESRKVRP